MFEWKESPYYWNEQLDRNRDEHQEEYHDHGMFLIHEIVPQTGEAVRNTAIGKEDIESVQGGGEVDYEESVEEAYGRVSAIV